MKRALVLLCAMSMLAACDSKSTKATATSPEKGSKVDTKKDGAKEGKKEEAKKPDAKKEGEKKPEAGAAKPVAAPPSGEAPKPDSGETAKTPPKAADLARYTSDLGEGTLMARIVTSKGEFTCELFEKDAPMTVANFVGLARGLKAWVHPSSGEVMTNTPLYSGVVFHRVIPNFMIQGGDPLGVGTGGPGYKFEDEISSKRHDGPGVLSMANAGPRTNGSQFFITEVATPHLNGKHTVFGQCDNLELIKEIARVEAERNMPKTPVVIERVVISRGEAL